MVTVVVAARRVVESHSRSSRSGRSSSGGSGNTSSSSSSNSNSCISGRVVVAPEAAGATAIGKLL